MQSGTPQTARETIAAELRRNHLTGCGAQYFDVLIAGYDAELESFARSVSNLKADLARLATQKAENLPDGSRTFEDDGERWRISLDSAGTPELFRVMNAREYPVSMIAPAAPHVSVLAEQFAALGREQGRAEAMREKVNILPGAKAIIERAEARIAALEAATRKIIEERDRWKNNYRAENHDLITARERIAELDKREADSRAEVADLLGRLEAQKARADKAERDVETLARVAAEKQDFYRRSAERWGRGIEQSRAALAQFRDRAEAAEGSLAVLEGELVAAKTVPAGRARTEGDVEMTAVYDGGNGGGYEPHVRLYVRRGDRIDELTETHGHYHPTTGAALSQPSHRWTQLPPLPPIEPTKAGAEEREPAPPALARHDWHTSRGRVSCERCGTPFSEGRRNQACGAQP